MHRSMAELVHYYPGPWSYGINSGYSMRSSIKGWSPRLGSISKGKRESGRGRAYTRGFVVLIDRFGMVLGVGRLGAQGEDRLGRIIVLAPDG